MQAHAKKYLIIGVVMLCLIGFGIAGAELLGGEPTTIVKQVDIVLGQEVKDKLASLETITSTSCTEYECIKYDNNKPPKCVAYSDSNCLRTQTTTNTIGINAPTITPKYCDAKECCYDLVDEPYYHRYDTCIPNAGDKNANETAIRIWITNDLQQIANNANTTNQTREQQPDTMETVIK